MPRRKQDCPKRMKWEEEARASGLLVDGDELDSPSSSPRNRRNSGSVTSRDATSPRMSPRHSPRESLNSSPGQATTSPRLSPNNLRHFNSPYLFKGFETEQDILDFSLHRSRDYREEILNMTSKSPLRGSPPLGIPRTGDSPLDLSVPRKRAADALLEAAAAHGNMNPMDLAKLSPWGFPLPPHLASTLALRPDLAALKSDLAMWNGKFKHDISPTTKLPPFPLGGHSGPTPSEASKALERMSELSKLGGEGGMGSGLGMGPSSDLYRSNNMGNSSGGRTNAWQSHWLSKGQDATKDVLKCVWCKASFSTLADLTTHMKEAKHCGVNLPPPIPPPTSGASLPSYMPSKMNYKPPVSSPGTASSSSSCDLISSIKETMPLPRKLVRGQDVWLGKGAEQTRQILKCMWCGQSFKSLAEMTRHMQQTQHYTNIISQEQIISWKSPEDKNSSQTHVNAVLTCKVCDQAFSSLKELSNHMVKYAHYKEHIMRSITESGSRRRQTREKRKKSLPVRKLLELERAQQEMRGGTNDYGRVKEGSPSRITCEKCGDKIDTPLFVEHIRTCVGIINRDMLKSSMLSPDPDHGSRYDSSKDTDSEGKLTPDKNKDVDPLRENFQEPHREKRESLPDTEGEKHKSEETKEPSVLYALEKLIEKSFDSGKAKPGGSPLGSSILRRLGIDEGTDYSKPLMDPQLMGMYATFSRLHTGHASSFNLPPSFGPGERGYGMRGPDTGHSPSGDSDTRDTFPRSPLRPNSRPDSRPASTGSINRDGSGSERSIEMIRNDLHLSMTEDNHRPIENGTDHSDNEIDSVASREEVGVKQEPNENNDTLNDREPISFIPEEPKIKEELRIKDEFKLKKEVDRVEEEISPIGYKTDTDRRSPTPLGRIVTSPTGSSRSGTPHSETSSNRGPVGGALGGLSALLGSVGGGESTGSSHPLAALQKLCDKTETQPRPSVTTGSMGPQSNPGAILAFSWACNDAVTADSIMKCAFCDTPFISKGAYRHHLSKMHFVKDGIIPEPGAPRQSQSGKMTPSASTPPAPVVDDSPHSKFLKYTELAKQLSSK